MGKKNKVYVFDPGTLDYRERIVTWREHLRRGGLWMLGSFLVFLVYLWLYAGVSGLELPKTTLLKKRNAEWNGKMAIMASKMEDCRRRLDALGLRDDGVYRTIFGMKEISPEERLSGLGGINRYNELRAIDHSGRLYKNVRELDLLTKMAYVQSKSYDEVDQMARHSGDIAACVPAIPPFYPGIRFHMSSPFGHRVDPVYKYRKMHTGQDFAMEPGNPIYAVGDGVVESVRHELFGYGNSLVINHGFGYKTRYAHLKMILVQPGQKVCRGDCIGQSGNSGKSTGPHLHYEVMYKGNYVNPINYMDMQIPLDEYAQMVKAREEQTGLSTDLVQPVHKDRQTIRKRGKRK